MEEFSVRAFNIVISRKFGEGLKKENAVATRDTLFSERFIFPPLVSFIHCVNYTTEREFLSTFLFVPASF